MYIYIYLSIHINISVSICRCIRICMHACTYLSNDLPIPIHITPHPCKLGHAELLLISRGSSGHLLRVKIVQSLLFTYIYLSIYLSIHLSIHLSIESSIHRSNYLSINHSINPYLSIYISIHVYIDTQISTRTRANSDTLSLSSYSEAAVAICSECKLYNRFAMCCFMRCRYASNGWSSPDCPAFATNCLSEPSTSLVTYYTGGEEYVYIY